jgi:plastocyanin
MRLPLPSDLRLGRTTIASIATVAALLVAALPAVPAHADVTVTMVGFEFVPRDVTIDVGEMVTWVNPEGMFHTVTSGLGSSDPDLGLVFDWPFFAGPDETFPFVFTEAGTIPYFCVFHEALDMRGTVTVTSVTSVPAGSQRDALRLAAAPNPALDGTSLSFRVTRAGEARVDVYDLTGRRVRELFRGALAPGAQSVRWDGRDDRAAALPSGVYLMRLDAPDGAAFTRVTLLH